MKIIQYCQHVLGVGHFFRTLEIARALKNNDVILVTGGRDVTQADIPDHVRQVDLPSLAMDAEFSTLMSSDASKSVDAIKEERRERLHQLILSESPDIFLVELYPFGRKAFRFELDPILAFLRETEESSTQVVCSLRDILVEKSDREKYENRVVTTLNQYFDALLVHADPNLVALEETFGRIHDIRIPIHYTGFVAPQPAEGSRDRLRAALGVGPKDDLMIASAGGGQVGVPLLRTVLEAFFRIANQMPVTLLCFTGPYCPDADFKALAARVHPRLKVRRFTDRFTDYLAAADLSVSMAGYNTCMNILAAGVPALVLPFDQNREQRMRAERLADMEGFQMLTPENLEPVKLAVLMSGLLKTRKRLQNKIDLKGATQTAAWVERFAVSKRKEN